MIPIKFRAWDKELKQMFEVIEMIKNNDGWILILHNNNVGRIQSTTSFSSLIQFTGLLDKNGKEIYEGDIVKWNFLEDRIAQIKFSGGAYHIEGWVTSTQRITENKLGVEIIGNIYENPEKLNPHKEVATADDNHTKRIRND